MSTLRSQLIKLAHQNPNVRKHVLPLLKQGNYNALIGNTDENATIRWRGYRGSLEVQDLTWAGKRGKTVETFTLYDIDFIRNNNIMELVHDLAEAMPHMTYMQAKIGAASIIQVAKEAGSSYPKFHEGSQRGVDVAPGGFKPIEINTEHAFIRVDHESFMVRDHKDQNNLPTCIPALKGAKKTIPQFYRWVKDNQVQLKSMTYREILDGMQKEGIPYHSFCAMD